MILSCNKINKSFGEKDILKDVSFHLNDNEKAAIIGANGAGKSTLFKIILGEMQADSGEVVFAKDSTFGCISQTQNLESTNGIYEELFGTNKALLELENRLERLHREIEEESGKNGESEELKKLLADYERCNTEFDRINGYAYKSEVTGVLKGLGFREDEFDKKIDTLSGGQKTRVALGKLLLMKPDLIMLDEPTNHLDMNSIAWLETFLANYSGAVLVIAHDRYFLDKVVTKVVEIENCKATCYLGNYTQFAEKKAEVRKAQLKAYMNQQRDIKHQEAVIEKLRSFNREKSIKRAESREKMLDKMERLEKPVEIDDEMKISFKASTVSGNDVLTVKGLTKSYGNENLFTDLDFEIKRGERVAIIGNNGTGKTTILKIINGLVQADRGEVKLGAKVGIAYYDQEHHVLNPENSPFEEISDAHPLMDNTDIRNILAAFLFTGDEVFTPIKLLSGGEHGRVSLAKLMLSKANLLILDEPTNHLDITSKEILENALNSYDGTVLYVSHDRYFINKTATRILDLTDRKLVPYIGNYDYYLEHKDVVEKAYLRGTLGNGDSQITVPTETDNKLDWKAQKEEQARLRKKQNEISRIEKEIAKLEEEGANVDKELENPVYFTDHVKLGELTKRKNEIEEKLLELMDEWERVSSEE
ncbi:MAG: ABC-F family ATP-binding cassette domain-containing protein [Lachnospiraceae bacterium]|nr:ABC-F family ATP-binding cassette domain-containing protein [Lachnospiraceae bacterium]